MDELPENKLDPYGQLAVAAEILYARAQRLSDAGHGRAAREVRSCAQYIDERFGGGLDGVADAACIAEYARRVIVGAR